MTFLRLLSSYAYQNFTYTCVNSHAWFDEDNLNHNHAIRLMGQDEQLFSIDTIKPNVIMDGCAVSYLLFALIQYNKFSGIYTRWFSLSL